ncbi:AbrB/MazE/SpoVT family DNA-binding domain-containing protein [Halotia branconii]|uniref:AbrB/MazE/SpoVT family DNA-binding domain-containing protein n=1 Tax=Halotia branconii CENA392 TaxID=1539056 RepID=A0AAJ6NT19_9CYAN|nr:AbrB/MazE/SpoVT family DNA-binding domain-containing protein [Halotia branconii]WGV25878.1 AbrB/MazE/SpoVT family DNA-binding domain-containing protein [Halotia branconii CENA392]
MAEFPTHVEVRLGEQGRLVIPAALRKSLGFEPGDTLIARLEDGRLVLEKLETVQRRLKARFSHVIKNTSLADELIAQRQEEAQREVSE